MASEGVESARIGAQGALIQMPDSPKKNRGVQSSLHQPEANVLSVKKKKFQIMSSSKKLNRTRQNQVDKPLLGEVPDLLETQ